MSENGINDVTIQILRSEEIKELSEISMLSDETLKSLGIKLGEIVRLRKIKYWRNFKTKFGEPAKIYLKNF